MLGLGLGMGAVQTLPLARYSLGGKAPAVVADPVAGVYGLGGRAVGFDSLFTFSRLSAAWTLNALGHWVKVLAGEPRTGHHVWKGGKLVPAGIAVCSEVRTNLASYSEDLASWSIENNVTVTPQGTLGGIPSFLLSDQTDDYGRVSQNLGPLGEGEFTCQMRVAKTGAKENAFGLRITFTADGSTQLSGISFDAETGAVINNWNSSVIERVVQDCGDHWHVWVSFGTAGIGTNDAKIQVFPAHNRMGGVAASTLTGDHRCTAIQVNEGRYPQDYIKTEATPVPVASESLQIAPSLLSDAFGGVMPEALAFAVEGFMTYADIDAFSTVRPLRYGESNSPDRIVYELSTNRADTGQMYFVQRRGGVQVSSPTGDTDKAPGLAVPFNYASRHIPSEFEGYSDGVETPSIAHDGLPQVLNNILYLAATGDLCITRFRIWAGTVDEVPTSAELQEATS
ncbi:MAG: hypothetical protein BM558_08970 [Roseobacter sp. MedPE-SW]|nr:MAG: hypothetical protein BM558_08970 [Roseobacter sp. MedPE-SW]